MKYCKDVTSTGATGYCCAVDGSEDTFNSCGASSNFICTDDVDLFPNNTAYTQCAVARASSECGVSSNIPINIDDGKTTVIQAQSVLGDELCHYLVFVKDGNSGTFNITASDTNLVTVSISSYNATTYAHGEQTTLNDSEVYTQDIEVNQYYKILVLPTSTSEGTARITITSPTTATEDDTDEEEIAIITVVLILALMILIFSIICACQVYKFKDIDKGKDDKRPDPEQYSHVQPQHTSTHMSQFNRGFTGRSDNYAQDSAVIDGSEADIGGQSNGRMQFKR